MFIVKSIIMFILFIIIVPTFLHELGHQIMTIFFGGEMIGFTLFLPSILTTFPDGLTDVQYAVIAGAGIGLTYGVTLFVVFVKKQLQYYTWLSCAVLCMLFYNFLMWGIYSVQSLVGFPPTDDIARIMSILNLSKFFVFTFCLAQFIFITIFTVTYLLESAYAQALREI